jgi:hypothetical protein
MITDAARLRPLARRAADPATQQLLRDTLVRAAALGADRGEHIYLVAGDATGDGAEAIPHPAPDVALFIEQISDDGDFVLALARAVAALTRWSAPDSASPNAQAGGVPWNRWEAAQNVALREWVYTEGVSLQLALALLPDLAPHQLLRVKRSAFNRLREREKIFRPLLDADLDERAIALILRWLAPDTPIGLRTIGDVVLPPMAGRYLAWRMTTERVARLGLRDAIRAEA